MKTFGERVNSFLKSLGGEKPKDKKEEEEEDSELDLDQLEDTEDGGNEDEEMNKSDIADATEIMTALVSELKAVNKSLAALAKRQDGIEKAQADVGEAVVGVAELVSKIANTPMPKKTVMAKGGLGNTETGDGIGSGGVLTQTEFEKAQRALSKACNEKRIELFEASKIEYEMQKAMTVPGYQMNPEYRAFISKELKTA